MIAALLPLLGGIGSQIAKNLFPDPADETKRQEIETQLRELGMDCMLYVA